MDRSEIVTRAAEGAAAGLAATMVLQRVRELDQKTLPSTKAPIRQEPGEFMVEKAESLLPEDTREQIPEAVETGAAATLALGYGMTFGAFYGLVRPQGGNVLLDGAALGVATWAVGYLGWLPAAKLMPPVSQQRPAQVTIPIVEHVLYGIAAVAGYAALRSLLGREERPE
jgi:hypothetical protein